MVIHRLLVGVLLAVLAVGGVLADTAYRLGAGDKVRVTVFGEADLSGEFEVSADGTLALPLIGEVKVGGLSLRESERLIGVKLADGYLQNPKVAIDVLNYRPFYILGEVRVPGKYPFETGMTVLTAVTLAGGFTYRADEKDILVIRAGRPGGDTTLRPVPLDMPVQPGDTIRVTERFF